MSALALCRKGLPKVSTVNAILKASSQAGKTADSEMQLGPLHTAAEYKYGRLARLGERRTSVWSSIRQVHDIYQLHDSIECDTAIFPRFMFGAR